MHLMLPMLAGTKLVHLLLLINTKLPGPHVDQEEQPTHDRQDLEEVVFGKVLLRVVVMELKQTISMPPRCSNVKGQSHRPPIVDKQIENAQNNNQHRRAPLRLESDNHHDTSHESQQTDKRPPEAPVASEHESDKQADQQHSPCELEIHLPVLLIDLRETGGSESLASPRVGHHHEQSTHDREVAQEEVQVEN